jgi:carboxypeptidase Q
MYYKLTRKMLLLPLMGVLSLTLYAQEKIDTAVMSQIRQEEFSHSAIPQISQQLFDQYGPRLTNSPGFHRAADWVVMQLKGFGIQHAALEPWGEFGRGWELQNFSMALAKPYYQPIIAQPLSWTHSIGPVTAPVISVLVDRNVQTFLNSHASEIKGKFILLDDSVSLPSPFVPPASRYTDHDLATLQDTYMHSDEDIVGLLAYQKESAALLSALQKIGALGILERQRAIGDDGTITIDDAPGKYNYKPGYVPTIPEIVISTEDFNKLTRMAKNQEPVEVSLNSQTAFFDKDLQGYNVIAEIPGSDPVLKNEVVMIGAHLDSWPGGDGATDNGAGCVVMMEVMRIFKQLNLHSKRTIRIALWSGEEQGSLGSYYYVKNHFGDQATMKMLPAQSHISAYYNLDNGSGKIRGIWAQNNVAAKSIFDEWIVPFKDLGATTVSLHNTGSTDHEPFDAIGIPAFQFIQDPLEYETRTHHTNMDVFDHLFIDDLKQAAVVVAGFVYNSANRPELLPRKNLPPAARYPFE